MFPRILVALDGSDTSKLALQAALALARSEQAELQPVYVVDIPYIGMEAPGFDPSIVLDALREEGKAVLADAASQMASFGVRGAPRLLELPAIGEDIAQGIEHAAREWHADLIVMGTHGRRGLRRLVLGSVAEHTARRAPCPLLLIPAGGQNTEGMHALEAANELHGS